MTRALPLSYHRFVIFRFINAMLHSQYYQAAASTLLCITDVMILTRGTLSTYVCTKANYVGIGAVHFILTLCFLCAPAISLDLRFSPLVALVRRRSCCPELNREEDSLRLYVCSMGNRLKDYYYV